MAVGTRSYVGLGSTADVRLIVEAIAARYAADPPETRVRMLLEQLAWQRRRLTDSSYARLIEESIRLSMKGSQR